jgi:hypothetical protein
MFRQFKLFQLSKTKPMLFIRLSWTKINLSTRNFIAQRRRKPKYQNNMKLLCGSLVTIKTVSEFMSSGNTPCLGHKCCIFFFKSSFGVLSENGSIGVTACATLESVLILNLLNHRFLCFTADSKIKCLKINNTDVGKNDFFRYSSVNVIDEEKGSYEIKPIDA